MAKKTMTKGDLLKLLTEDAKIYLESALTSTERNKRMNDLTPADFLKIGRNKHQFQKFADALLVDFINFVGVGQGIDYGLYTKHLKE